MSYKRQPLTIWVAFIDDAHETVHEVYTHTNLLDLLKIVSLEYFGMRMDDFGAQEIVDYIKESTEEWDDQAIVFRKVTIDYDTFRSGIHDQEVNQNKIDVIKLGDLHLYCTD